MAMGRGHESLGLRRAGWQSRIYVEKRLLLPDAYGSDFGLVQPTIADSVALFRMGSCLSDDHPKLYFGNESVYAPCASLLFFLGSRAGAPAVGAPIGGGGQRKLDGF